MAELEIGSLGCSEACPIAPYAEEALRQQLDEVGSRFKQAQDIEERRRQAWHESDGNYTDIYGDLDVAEFTKDSEERSITAQALTYKEIATHCDGQHCILAKYCVSRVVQQDLKPSKK